MGQPRSSKSTQTCSPIGVLVASVLMYSGRGVDLVDEVVDVGPVLEGLDAAGGGAGADGDQELALLADLLDAVGVVRGGDGAFDEADVVGAADLLGAGFEEEGDLDGLGDGQQLVFGVEQARAGSRRRRRT